jgi:DUF4097 and DUF4098 domain-containing protein YvlB
VSSSRGREKSVFPLGSWGGANLSKIIFILFAAAYFAAPAFARTSQNFEQTFPLSSGGSFTLENVNGSVHVEGWQKEEVEVKAVKVAEHNAKDAADVKIDIQSDPQRVDVRTEYPQGQGAQVSVEYHIRVPYRVLLAGIVTVNGSVMVRGVNGSGELRSVNGNVEVVDSSGRFNEHTTNGDLRMELRKLPDGGPMAMETVNGSVSLGLPADAQADLRMLSMNGDLYSDLPLQSQGTLSARSFHGKMGAGGGEVSVRTINGVVRVFVEHAGS